MSYELLEKFTNTVIPNEMKDSMKRGLITLSRNMIKMMLFAHDNNITNENIDYWMSFGPQRQESESFAEYKDRQKFQSALAKYRPYLYYYEPIK